MQFSDVDLVSPVVHLLCELVNTGNC